MTSWLRTAGTRGRRRRRTWIGCSSSMTRTGRWWTGAAGKHMKVGFALQMVTVRWLGTFLEEPLDVPGAVLDFVAGQLGVADPSQVGRST